MKRRQLRGFDLKQINGVTSLIGVDEVGRGAFAGPVVAAAVVVTREFLEGRWALTKSGRVNDSKLLSAEQREELWDDFDGLSRQGQIHAHCGVATVAEIEQLLAKVQPVLLSADGKGIDAQFLKIVRPEALLVIAPMPEMAPPVAAPAIFPNLS